MRKKFAISFGVTMLVATLGILGIYTLFWPFGLGFDYSVKSVITVTGHRVEAAAFLDTGEEMTHVSAQFANPERVDFSAPGRQTVALTLTRGERTLDTTAAMYVLNAVEYLHFEFADATNIPPTAEDFITNAHILAMPVQPVFLSALPNFANLAVGRYYIDLHVAGVIFRSAINVADTTPPTATPVNRTMTMGQDVFAEDFVVNIQDASPIGSIGFVSEPDIYAPGEQVVEVYIEDIFGNRAVFTSTLTLRPNEIPPTITGVRDLEIMRGNPIMFRQGVSATDAFGRDLEFTVDSSRVDANVLGAHTVVYIAEDSQGLRTEVTATVHIVDVDPAWINQRTDEILAGILRDGMTQVQQARAIFDWIGQNVGYAADIGRETVYEGAFQALTQRRGNCFVFYSISEVMLTRAGIPNMRIDRIPGTRTRHRWNLVNPDDMGWFHFDTTPNRVTFNRFMFTNTQAVEFTELIQQEVGTRYYYVFDPTLYPEIIE
ncbi:MAG: transglutaminase-like domain-containing protein [Defluviitaleaceae bacterium]|nr:transglutaminase-like domain-containing protein [Defluviitaleaceae bacterium]